MNWMVLDDCIPEAEMAMLLGLCAFKGSLCCGIGEVAL